MIYESSLVINLKSTLYNRKIKFKVYNKLRGMGNDHLKGIHMQTNIHVMVECNYIDY